MKKVRLQLGLLTTLLCATASPLSADIPSPPILRLRSMPSPGCPQTPLDRAVAARRDDVLACTTRGFVGTLPIECRFNDAWRVTRCTVPPDAGKRAERDGLDARILRCMLGALSHLALRPGADSPPPSGCVAHIQFEQRPGPRHRVGRPTPETAPID